MYKFWSFSLFLWLLLLFYLVSFFRLVMFLLSYYSWITSTLPIYYYIYFHYYFPSIRKSISFVSSLLFLNLCIIMGFPFLHCVWISFGKPKFYSSLLLTILNIHIHIFITWSIFIFSFFFFHYTLKGYLFIRDPLPNKSTRLSLYGHPSKLGAVSTWMRLFLKVI